MGKRVCSWPVALVGILAAAVLGLFLVRASVGWLYIIRDDGMYPTLPAGSWMIGQKHPYADSSAVARGDIVLFEHEVAGERFLSVGRVIGLPGDNVEIDGDRLLLNDTEPKRVSLTATEEAGELYEESLDGVAYNIAFRQLPVKNRQPGLLNADAPLAFVPINVILQVPADHLFVLGDNRRQAIDSRTLGPIPFGSIVGKKW